VQFLKQLLERLIEDSDPRDLLYTTIKHRPKETALPKAVALYVALGCHAGTPEKAAKSYAGELSRFTKDQVKHSLKQYRGICELIVHHFDGPRIGRLVEYRGGFPSRMGYGPVPERSPSDLDLLRQWNARYLHYRSGLPAIRLVQTKHGMWVQPGKK
jgi:hypothetical protein